MAAAAPAFDPSPQALAARLAALDPSGSHQGTALSPYLTHGFTDAPAVLGALAARHAAPSLEPLRLGLARREFCQHFWRHHGTAIVKDLGPPPGDFAYAEEVPEDVRTASTGVARVDGAVRSLYATGWLPQEERVLLASYVVHARRVRWRAGADWLYGHLLDGELASNHLAWQQVAGTFGGKPVVIDAGEATERPVPVEEPPLLPEPPGIPHSAVPPRFGRETVAIVHPWNLAGAPDADAVLVACHAPFHERFRWSARRWDFVLGRMRELADEPWFGDLRAMVRMNRATRFVTTATRNLGYAKAFEEANVEARAVARFLPDPDEACLSFEAFREATARPASAVA